jgi:hypothetical protein
MGPLNRVENRENFAHLNLVDQYHYEEDAKDQPEIKKQSFMPRKVLHILLFPGTSDIDPVSYRQTSRNSLTAGRNRV